MMSNVKQHDEIYLIFMHFNIRKTFSEEITNVERGEREFGNLT